MLNSFDNYLKAGKVKRKTKDPEEARALFNKSLHRLEYTKMKEITENNSQFVLEDSYESIREAAQSLMSLHGFKPYSHEATIAFIKDYYKEFSDGDIHEFDRLRQLRNNSVYRAENVSIEDSKKSIIFAEIFIEKVKRITNNS